MKTLNEVIEALKICGHDESPKCPFFDTEHWCCCEDHMRSIYPLKNDALYHLNKYRMTLDDIVAKRKKLEREIDNYQEAVKKCEEAENKYRMLIGELEGFPSNTRMNIRW